jgi:hypothetical protein
LPFGVEAAKEAARSEAAISYELYRICRNAIQADDIAGQSLSRFVRPPGPSEGAVGLGERFGEPHSDNRSLLFSGNFRLVHVIPEFRISPKDRVDLLITVEESKNLRPFFLFECKRRPFQKPGPSYAKAIHRQAMRYAHALALQYYAVFDGWVIILGKRSYPFLLGIFDALIGDTLTPNLIRSILASVHDLENSKPLQLESLIHTSRPRDPEFLSRQVLPFIAKGFVPRKKGEAWSEIEKGKVEYLVKEWREKILLL